MKRELELIKNNIGYTATVVSKTNCTFVKNEEDGTVFVVVYSSGLIEAGIFNPVDKTTSTYPLTISELKHFIPFYEFYARKLIDGDLDW